ncbi:protein of unknown function DUF192 [Desulfotomaculum nigrificans CO-1-SRB]|uniref:DUF192 domain-containing protein n=2 Tax=Desulfotomaculum nigrificans TaxID=1565 RepID=F6B5I2_DESCC|nr:protein of unknown function DUF192 [Desulfotomaculum nigrificans CO-1-SRB]
MPQISPTSSQITLDNVNFIANTFLTRLRGLLGRSEMPKNTCLILTPCRQVHTFFMRFPIGAVFLNKQGVVGEYCPGLCHKK